MKLDLLDELFQLFEAEVINAPPPQEKEVAPGTRKKPPTMKAIDNLIKSVQSDGRVQKKPPLRDNKPTIDNPETKIANKGQKEHPVIQQRDLVDKERESGVPTVQAHQSVFGDINTGDVESKAGFAATLARVETDKSNQEVYPEKGSESVFGKEFADNQNRNDVSPEDLRTPEDQELPDNLQPDSEGEFDSQDDEYERETEDLDNEYGDLDSQFGEHENKYKEGLAKLTAQKRRNAEARFGHLRDVFSSIENKATKKTMVDAIGLAHAYTGRINSGAGKNALGIADRDTLMANRDRLIAGYGDGDPAKVKKFVESTRLIDVDDKQAEAFFDMLPAKIQMNFKVAGKIGPDYKGHYLGKNPDGTEKRGTLGGKDRGILVAKLLLQQGLKDAYTGLPLDLNKVDLEHVVGFKNDDRGKPTQEDWNKRENIDNFVLTSSNVNQLKSDKNMEAFLSTEVDKLKDFSEEDFQSRDALLNRGNTINTSAGILAQLFMRDGKIDKKEKRISKLLHESVSSENFDAYTNMDRQLAKEINSKINKFGKEKGVKLQNVKNRLGYEMMKKLKLSAYLSKPPTLDSNGNVVSQGRGNQAKFDDKLYTAVISSLLEKQTDEERDALLDVWEGARKSAHEAQGKSGKTGDGKKALISHLIQNGFISQRFLENKEFARYLKEEFDYDDAWVILTEGEEMDYNDDVDYLRTYGRA